MEETGDLGLVPEKELSERMWPGGVPLNTAAPGVQPKGGTFNGATNVTITCSTEGASIAYTTEGGNDAHWLLYTGELKLDSRVRLRTKAIRIGYAESPEVQADFSIL